MKNASTQADQSELVKKAVLELRELKAKVKKLEQSRNEPIAIIGTGCRFPNGISTPNEFWQQLAEGVDAISEIPSDRWDVHASYDPNPGTEGKSYIRHGGFVDGIDLFDADFFNISPRECRQLDPQHRLLLEVSWESLENAGISPQSLQGTETGVYVGLMNMDYVFRQYEEITASSVDHYMITGNSNSFLSGRLSHVLGTQGPSMVISTACSSSLVTVHLASQALRNGECDMALAGGVNVILDPTTNAMLSQMEAIAPDGRCKTFDASANGYSRGEGCGMVVLKRLSDAQADGDNILALIRGSAVNHDGSSAGLTVPNGPAQEKLLRKAFKSANVSPSDISYIEAHGTGTELGDPIEIQALSNLLEQNRKTPLNVGSVKTNIGHLEAAAGIAGVIKTVLSLQNKQIPPSLHYNSPNPLIPWSNIPLKVVEELTPWKRTEDGKPLVAGVSSFGLSGVNAHAVIEEAPIRTVDKIDTDRPLHILSLSAQSKDALQALALRYADHFKSHPDLDIADSCYTANTGRAHLKHRIAITATSTAEAQEKLLSATGITPFRKTKTAFMFTGQGSQYPNMGRELYETQPSFRKALCRCDEILRDHIDVPLLTLLYPDLAKDSANHDPELIHQTAYAQPALFSLEYALSELWRSWGIKPDTVLGHSAGEYVAALVAGVYSLEDGLKLISLRGRLMQALPTDGKMTSVNVSESTARDAIKSANSETEVSISAINGPESIVLSGSIDAVNKTVEAITGADTIATDLEVSHAFHSHLMEPMVASFADAIKTIPFSKPGIRLISNITGKSLQEEISADYWCRHLRQAVRFADSIKTLEELKVNTFLEIGPRPLLLALGQQSIANPDALWLSTLRKEKDWQQVLSTLAHLYESGANINWSSFEKDYASGRKKVSLPNYPFQRSRHWALKHSTRIDNRSAPTAESPVPSIKQKTLEPSIRDTTESPTLLAQVKNTEEAKQKDIIASALSAKVAQTLGRTQVDTKPSLLELGFDSVMAMEIKRWCMRELGIDLNIVKFLSNLGIEALADELRAQLLIAAPKDPKPLTSPAKETSFPLSHGQQALWFMNQNDPENTAFNVALALRVFSDISNNELKQVFQILTDRHPALRTTFSATQGDPIQTVHESMDVNFDTIDASKWDDTTLSIQVDAEHNKVFDLSKGPLLRIRIFECSTSEKVMLLSFHHIICDSQSIWTLLLEMRDIYAAIKRDTRIDLPPLHTDFNDYVHWQNELLSGDEGDRSWAFWRKRLDGDLPSLDLKTDHPRPAVQTYNGSSVSIVLNADLTDKLRRLAGEEKVTLNSLLSAAYQVLLHRYSGQTDILLGIPTAGQNQSKFERVVGYFINTIVLRSDLSDNPAFRDFMKQVHSDSLEAIEHQDYPFSLLVKKLQPKRDSSRSPIIQTRFSLQKAAIFSNELDITQRIEWGDFSLEPFELAGEEGLVDINMMIIEGRDSLNATLKYNTDLFNAATIERMAAHFLNILNQLTADPGKGVSALPLLSQNEREKVLVKWNDTATEAPSKCFHQLFEEQVSRTPDQPAVSFENKSLSYEELNCHANQLANRLQDLGVGPETIVGIHMERSLELAIALLGVCKAGGAYLPIDSKMPSGRINFIMSDSKAPILLTQDKLSNDFTSNTLPQDTTVINLTSESQELDKESKENPQSKATPDNCAYVIYTSGSTGKPKGVEVLHKGLSNYICWVADTFNINEGSGTPVISSVGFDLTVTSLLPPLLVGNTVHFLKEGDEVEALAESLKSGKDWSLIKLTPTHLEMLSHLLPTDTLKSATKNLVIGGELLSGEQLEFWQKHSPDTQLFNHYGPTEATVGCCYNPITKACNGPVPIGKPITNTQLYILNPHLEPEPIGVAGELFIGGAGVARGYLNHPELTRERFVPNPFGDGMLFRTGDLARYLEDGNIEFLGRADSQVKIRGFRIELNEIQLLLNEYPDVKDSTVTIHEGEEGDKQIVAYIIPKDKSFTPHTANRKLRQYLADNLPEYMVPSHFVLLQSFPLISNGKIDLKALPDPDISGLKDHHAIPRDAMELELTAIWESILELHPIGIHDSFFDLGGHSILAIKLTAKIQKKFSVNLPLGELLKNDTVAKLAEHLRKSPTPWSPLVAIKPSGDRPPLFGIPGAGGNVVYFRKLAQLLGPDQPFYGLQAAGLDGSSEPHSTVEEMAAFYIEAMKTLQPEGPYHLCGHSLGGWVAFEMSQQLIKQGEKVEYVGIIDTPTPTDQREDRSGWNDAKWICELTDRIQHLLTADLQVSLEELESLNFDRQLEYFKSRLNKAKLFPAEVGIDQLKNVIVLFKAQSQVHYFPKDIVPSQIILYRTDTVHENIPASDDTWGWDNISSVETHRVPGEHLTILTDPYVETLAKAISQSMSLQNA